MSDRNKVRKNGKDEDYKRLRNECNKRIRREKQMEAGRPITEDPNNIWKLYNKTVNGKKDVKIKLKEDGKIIDDDHKVANIFNQYFKEKIEDIKS